MNKPEITKTHFKMYKDGKHWVFAGLMLLSVPMALMGSLEVSASADEKGTKSIAATVGSPDETTVEASGENVIVTDESVATTVEDDQVAALADAKKTALESLEKADNLDEVAKATFKGRVETAKTLEEVTTIEKEIVDANQAAIVKAQ